MSVARNEPLNDIAHLGHVELLTPKPDESLWYFSDMRYILQGGNIVGLPRLKS